MGRLSRITQGAQCNHKGPYKEVAGRSERKEVMFADIEDGGREALEAGKDQKENKHRFSPSASRGNAGLLDSC